MARDIDAATLRAGVRAARDAYNGFWFATAIIILSGILAVCLSAGIGLFMAATHSAPPIRAEDVARIAVVVVLVLLSMILVQGGCMLAGPLRSYPWLGPCIICGRRPTETRVRRRLGIRLEAIPPPLR